MPRRLRLGPQPNASLTTAPVSAEHRGPAGHAPRRPPPPAAGAVWAWRAGARRILGRVNRRVTAQTALAIGALGVVFGDIGTSPLYTVQTAFNPHDPHPLAATRENIFG